MQKHLAIGFWVKILDKKTRGGRGFNEPPHPASLRVKVVFPVSPQLEKIPTFLQMFWLLSVRAVRHQVQVSALILLGIIYYFCRVAVVRCMHGKNSGYAATQLISSTAYPRTAA